MPCIKFVCPEVSEELKRVYVLHIYRQKQALYHRYFDIHMNLLFSALVRQCFKCTLEWSILKV